MGILYQAIDPMSWVWWLAVVCISDQVASEYAAYHSIQIQLAPEMFCVVLAGVARLYKVRPDASDEDVSTIIAQTLRLDMRVIDEPTWQESPVAHPTD